MCKVEDGKIFRVKSINMLYDSVSNNIGDIAIGVANKFLLSKRNLQVINQNPLEKLDSRTTIVGGGELLRISGDPFYDNFRLEGCHVLNASGVNYNSDRLQYLQGYSWVSARTNREAEILSKFTSNVRVVPCSTTVWVDSLTSKSRKIRAETDTLGIHLVPHSYRTIENLRQIISNIPGKKIFFSFTPYNGDMQFMRALFGESRNVEFKTFSSPEDAVRFIGSCRAVITTSLHASIFAYSQKIPFISIAQTKVSDYFSDRKMSDRIVGNDAELSQGIEHLLADFSVPSASVDLDIKTVNEAFDEYAQQSFDQEEMKFLPESFRTTDSALKLQSQQSQIVISDHDSALTFADERLQAIKEKFELSEERLKASNENAENWKASYLRLRNHPIVRILHRMKTVVASLSRLSRRDGN